MKLLVQVASFFPNDRLRAFEALRPAAKDIAPHGELLSRFSFGAETEARCSEQLLTVSTSESLGETHERGGTGPEERSLARLRVSPSFDVTETFWTRPALAHGNLKEDGADSVSQSIVTAAVPEIPTPPELARRYGNFASEALHHDPGSVYLRLCDAYRQERGVDISRPQPNRRKSRSSS